MKKKVILKKFESNDTSKRTRDFKKAKMWLENGENVHAFIVDVSGTMRETSRLKEIDCEEMTFVTANHNYQVTKIDNRVRRIVIRCFYNCDEVEFVGTNKLDVVRQWVEQGDVVKANYYSEEKGESRTSQIYCIDVLNCKFETIFGTQYSFY